MNILSQIYPSYQNEAPINKVVMCKLMDSDCERDVHYLLENIELDKNKKNVHIFVLQEEINKQILGVGCVLFKLTKKYRIGVIGEIYNIHVHKSVNMEKQHEFIKEIANFAINSGCYTCTLENTNS